MFRGISAIQLDDKGRMAIPARYRDFLQQHCEGKLVLTIDTDDQCLLLYPLPEWEEIERKIEALPSFNRTARRVQRLLMGHATELELDSHGRILVPPPLRDHAKLSKQSMLVGQGKKFEIWDAGVWHQHMEIWVAEESVGAKELPPDLQSLSL